MRLPSANSSSSTPPAFNSQSQSAPLSSSTRDTRSSAASARRSKSGSSMGVINSAGDIIVIMRRIMRCTAGLLLVFLLLSACGTKGPLRLPTPEQKAQQKQQDNKQQPARP